MRSTSLDHPLLVCGLLGAIFTASACSDAPSPEVGDVDLRSDAMTYELVPGVPPSFFTLTFVNNTGAEVAVLTCIREGHILAAVQYQQQQATQWVNIPWNRVDCGTEVVQAVVPDGASWTVPNVIGTPPVSAGTYRVLLPYTRPNRSVTARFAISNTFTVIDNLEPTGSR